MAARNTPQEGWPERWQRWRQNLTSTYRLIVMNDETFEEVTSYRMTRLNVYSLLSAVLVTVTLLVVAAIVFTPLRLFIPGYAGDPDASRKIRQMQESLLALQEKREADSVYISQVRRLLTGDYERVPDENSVSEEAPLIPDELLNSSPSEEDIRLREAVENEQPEAEAPSKPQKPQPGQPQKARFSKPIAQSLEQLYFATPVSGSISLGFEPDNRHYGVDILAPKNTPIKAVMDGMVIFSDWTLETGNTIVIQHDNNVLSAYKHNSALLKKKGDRVKSGEAVAIIGNTGTLSDGPHLHFELWHDRQAIDPTAYIKF